jgi:DNA-binding MarR family transcriptional regulator
MAVGRSIIRQMFHEESLGTPENAVGFVLWRIVQRYQREMDRALEPLDLTNLQFVTLALVAWFGRSGEVVSQAAIARFGGIHPMQLSQMLTTLEKKGFISRKRSRTDTRTKEVALTPAGLAAVRKSFPLAIEVQTRLFGAEGKPGGKLQKNLRDLDDKLNQMFEA